MRFFCRLRETLAIFVHLIPELFRMAYGAWKISRLPRPRVSIFGGSKMSFNSPYALKAMELSGKLVTHNISVITGGGPGIMQAANCGASPDGGTNLRSMGITVYGFKDEIENKCAQQLIYTNYFWSRKWLLTFYSDAFVIFPGGFGTLDEIGEVTTLMQTKKMGVAPIVLIGKEFWSHFAQWVERSEKEGLVKEEDRNLIYITDDVDEALHRVHVRCEMVMERKLHPPKS
jgi:uncharacterized protein (TIGR00730 family)